MPVLAADSWPASSSGTNISGSLASTLSSFYVSGLTWHQGRGQIITVSDNGYVAAMDPDGSDLETWYLGSYYDLEGVTVVDSTSSVIYLGDENPDSIIAFDLSSGSIVGTWDLTSWMASSNSNLGLEGLTYVPAGRSPYSSNGVFYASLQETGDTYVFEVDTSVSGGEVSYLGHFSSSVGFDTSDIFYFNDSDSLFIIHDTQAELEELATDGSALVSYNLSTSISEEGIAFTPADCSAGTATIFIGDDAGTSIYSFENFPIICADRDGDGYNFADDCNDSDPLVYEDQTYYLDADGDGLGSDTTTAICSSVPPAGYVANSDDTNDSIPNGGVEIRGDSADNDGDGRVDEVNTLSENGAHPYYSTLDPASGKVFGRDILAVSVTLITHQVNVTYADNSVYAYSVFSSSAFFGSKALSSSAVFSLGGSGYLGVWFGTQAVVMNGYTGSVVATGTLRAANRTAFNTWLLSLFTFKYGFK